MRKDNIYPGLTLELTHVEQDSACVCFCVLCVYTLLASLIYSHDVTALISLHYSSATFLKTS